MPHSVTKLGDPELVIWELVDRFSWYLGVQTEVDIARDTLREAIDLLPMWLTQCLPVCVLKSPASSDQFNSPWQSLNQGLVK